MRHGTRYAIGLGLLLLGAPLPVDAGSPDRATVPALRGVREARATLGRVTVAARLQTDRSGQLVLDVEATNPAASAETVAVAVELYGQPELGLMARMVPPPRLRSRHEVSLRVVGGGRASHRVVVSTTGLDAAGIARLYPVLRPASPARAGALARR